MDLFDLETIGLYLPPLNAAFSVSFDAVYGLSEL